MGTLFVLCGVLGVLQYQWIGEFSMAAGDRLRAALEVSLSRLSQDFHSEIANALREAVPMGVESLDEARAGLETRFEQAKKNGQPFRVFRRIGLAVPRNGEVRLELLNKDSGKLAPGTWPDSWEGMRDRLSARAAPPFGPMEGGPRGEMDGLLLETPVFMPGPPGPPGPPPGMGPPLNEGKKGHAPGRPFGRREMGWLLLELDPEYLGKTVLPEVVDRHLETSEYDVQVIRSRQGTTVWESSPKSKQLAASPDAWIGLLDVRFSPWGEGGRGRGGRNGGRGPGRGPAPGRWTLYVRHQAGSLDAVVTQTRWKNFAVTGGVLLLLMATIVALFRFTRNAQQLAHLQMDFVAGVSHELRTPLTAIYTAAYNLRGRLAHNPAQVERYGEMIQHESGRLRDLVEQVLRFASANAGRVIQTKSPLAARKLIEDTLEASRCSIQAAHFTVEQKIEDELPEILADPLALRHALQNLLANAVKYGAQDEPWIGIAASKVENGRGPAVEIRVADRGPGIPEEEQKHIFDAFYRGRRAVQDQIHGAGLGLNLAKKIIEAHGGSIRVKSAPGHGAEFIVEIPAAPAGEAA
jgi:signal transduction histidine kinase